MTGHRATVRVDGVTWSLHADGSRTATVGAEDFRAEPTPDGLFHLYRHDPAGGSPGYLLTCRRDQLSRAVLS